MHWSIVAVQILIVTVTLSYSFPVDLKEIDLKEIEHEDIYLVDKQRKGRFIQVNQTTFQPNDFELVRAKKSSPLNVKETFNEPTNKIEKILPAENDINPLAQRHLVEKADNGNLIPVQYNSSSEDSLIEPHLFGYPSFFEDVGPQPYFPSPMQMPPNDHCCNVHKYLDAWTTNLFPCIDQFIVPGENLFC